MFFEKDENKRTRCRDLLVKIHNIAFTDVCVLFLPFLLTTYLIVISQNQSQCQVTVEQTRMTSVDIGSNYFLL